MKFKSKSAKHTAYGSDGVSRRRNRMKLKYVTQAKPIPTQRELDSLKLQVADATKTIERYREEIAPVIDNLIKAHITREYLPDYSYRTRYQVAFEIDADLVERGLMHGDSQYLIKEIAHRAAFEVERELRTLNFARIPKK